ncbi:MAG: rod shape-determining protein [Lachnospiraceae bacterium]|nr:rod shape-determining protein [Lachnospiraceae bacterium]
MSTINSFGIDLGTSNIKIFSEESKSIFVERNMIAIENKRNLLAYGDSAYAMYEKSPSNIVASYPVCNGVIADIQNMETLVKYFINDLSKGGMKMSDYYVAVPTDVTEVEKKAFYDLIKESSVKARKIMVVEKAIADGLGLGIDVKTSQGVMVINVGYATTEISILSLGGIVLSRLIKVGGFKFGESVRNAIRKEYSLLIGEKTAEKTLESLYELEINRQPALVFGRDIVSGLPIEREIPTKLIDEALIENFATIIDNIKVILERTPPELGADIRRQGIYLTGGASQISRLASLIERATDLKVNVPEEPITTVALGLAKVIKDDKFNSLAYYIEGMGR